MLDVRLVVCDIDNTLVMKRKPLTKRARDVIVALQSKGVYFGLASGRPVHMLQSLENQWDIKSDLLIGMNGAEYYDAKNSIHEIIHLMKREWIKEAFEIMSEFTIYPQINFDNVMYVRKDNPYILGSQAYIKSQNEAHIVEDDSEFWHAETAKVGFRVLEEEMPLIEAAVASKKSTDEYIGFKTEMTMYEFSNALAQKGTLLKRFYESHNIPKEAVYSFGDMTNDISLFNESGVSVCMINGSEDAKKHADIITDLSCNEDGWADYMEKHVLPYLN